VNDATWGESVFKPYVIREMIRRAGGIIVRPFPYTPIANRAGCIRTGASAQRRHMQKMATGARRGCQDRGGTVAQWHDVDLKMASRVTGIDAILGGHTHDGVPAPTVVSNKSGKTLVCNSGSNGKFLVRLLDPRSRAASSAITATSCYRCSPI